MAISIRKCSFSQFWNCHKYLHKYDKRHLFCEADLKMDRFLRQRIFKKDELGISGKDSILKKLERIETPLEAKHSVYSFIDLIHISENKDLHILKSVLSLISKSDIITIEDFNFGASLLRLYYYLGLPLEAYGMYKDPVCHHILSDNTCHRILMDMLYSHKHYQEVLDVFEGLKRFNIDCVTLALAAYYHIDTDESFIAAQTIIDKYFDNYALPRRALLFFCMLSINQNKPGQALKVLKICKENNLSLNIKLMALAKLGQASKIMEILEQMKNDSGNVQVPLLCRIYSDTMNEIEQVLKEKLSQKDFASFCFLREDLSDRAVLSRQTVNVLLERTIPGNISHRKNSGKQKVIRDFPSMNTETKLN